MSPDEFTGSAKELFIFTNEKSEKQALPYAKISIPQSLNKYQYCYNNPLNTIDPSGHEVEATNQSSKDRNEVKGRLIKNLSSSEKKYFKVEYDKDKKGYFLVTKGDVSKALGKPHTKAFEYLVQTIKNDKRVTVEIRETVTESSGDVSVSKDYGGGVTYDTKKGNADVQVYLSRNGHPKGTVLGMNGNQVPDPVSLIAAHEVLGHARLAILGQPNGEREAKVVENEVREGRGYLPKSLP